LLVLWCAGDRCDIAGSDEDHDRSKRPGTEDQRWSGIGRVLGGRTIERSGDVVCGLHRAREDEEREFLGLASKPRSTVCRWFGLKTTWMVSPALASKPVAMVSPGLASKSVASGFLVWTSKLAAMVW
jgi:hypothetical protein